MCDFDGCEEHARRWAVEAGALLLKEAGGEVRALGEQRGISLIAGNGTICSLIHGVLTGPTAHGRRP